ncbi:RES family NAD+ phosphorylase [Cognatiluteimonas telluris]|uniref:RES family NAD+ phosphorylase n=1 Tax=Cognatiluteimonas telluris TaxID=1104775 RepID=UPI00140A3546|nr:RES family NAD+ phosphorylase [Lysobacter telluris]
MPSQDPPSRERLEPGSLDKALADSFPASDPPSQTSPVMATPSSAFISTDESGELRIYRVIEPKQAAEPFAATDTGARWTPAGTACVYASLSPATAILEFLVHLEGRTPKDLLLAVGAIRAESVVSEINEPSTWCKLPYRPEVQQVGKAWLESGRSLAMRVPSAICRDECNVLINPGHAGFAGLQLLALRPLTIDERLRT